MNLNKETKSLQEGAVMLLIATVIAKIIGALFKIPLSSSICLGDLGFGYFSVAYDLFTPIYTLAISGFPVAISKMISETVAKKGKSEIDDIFYEAKRFFLLIGVIATALLLVAIGLYISFNNTVGESIYSILAVIPSVICCFAVSVYRGYFEGFCNMKPAAVSNIIEALCKLVLGFGLAFITISLTGNAAFAAAAALIGITLGTLFSALYLKFKYDKLFKIKKRINKQRFTFKSNLIKSLCSIILPAVAVSLSSGLVVLIDALTIRSSLSGIIIKHPGVLEGMYGLLISQSGEAVTDSLLPTLLYGIRSKAYTLYNIIPTFTVVIGVGAIPVLTGYFSAENNKELKSEINTTLKLSSIISFPAGIGLIALHNEIMSLLFGASASSELGGKMLFILGFAAIFSGLAIPMGCVLQAINKGTVAVKNIVISILIKIFLNVLLCANLEINIFGAIISTVICFFVMFILNLFTLIKSIGKTDIKSAFLKPLLAALICGITAVIISKILNSAIGICIAILAAVLVYIVFLFVFRIFSETDILAVPFGNKLLKSLKTLKIL